MVVIVVDFLNLLQNTVDPSSKTFMPVIFKNISHTVTRIPNYESYRTVQVLSVWFGRRKVFKVSYKRVISL